MCNGHDCNVALISGASARLDKKKKKTSEQITPERSILFELLAVNRYIAAK